MELNSGADLVSLKESIQAQYSAESADSPDSITDAVQYARCHGLTVDSSLLHWKNLVAQDPIVASTFVDLPDGQLVEAVQLQECLFRPIIPTPEHWQMPAASLRILHEVCRPPRQEDLARLVLRNCLAECSKWNGLKLEVPALRSDHGTDCRRQARRVKAFLKEPLPEHRLPLHPVEIDKGEGIEFPACLTLMETKWFGTIEQERLEISRAILEYLRQSLSSEMTETDRQDFAESVSAYRGVGARERLTPPLTPLQPSSPEPFVPEDETCRLPEPSVPSSRLSEDLEAAEARVFETELAGWTDVLVKQVPSGSDDHIDVSEAIRAGGLRLDDTPSRPVLGPWDFRVDVPLLPCSDETIAAVEPMKVIAPEVLVEAKELVASSDTASGSDGPTGQLVSLFLSKATTVMRCAEQEKLQPLDATARVPVPALDFSTPVPEWEQRIWKPKEMFRWIQKEVDVDWQGAKWAHSRAAEQRMVWAPLAHMKEKNLVSEQIAADRRVLDAFLHRNRDGETLTSADYVYKEPGLAVLRVREGEDDDDDYITPLGFPQAEAPDSSRNNNGVGSIASSSLTNPSAPSFDSNLSLTGPLATRPPADLPTLLRGRKRLIDEALQKTESRVDREGGFTAASTLHTATGIIDSAMVPTTNVLRGFMNEYTDFAPLVDNFVEMNFPKKPKLGHSAFFHQRGRGSTVPSKGSTVDEAVRLMPPPPKPIVALAPDIRPPDNPPRVVVSTAVPPLVTQYLQKLLPGIELIHRDHTKHKPPGWFPGQRPPNLDEADIVISPATGLLLTTMVRLRQKPVPGQAVATATSAGNRNNHTATAAATVPFGRVVENVALRHERLVVLVSEGNKHSETASPLSQSDAHALAEFQGFAAGLQTAEVRVVYVGGGAETLARWAAAVICEHAREAQDSGVRDLLLPVETMWEVFLRRAGMNVYAAQVVLGRLRVPGDQPAIGGEDGQVFGLPLFVMMSQEARIEMFEGVFRGRRMLERVGEVLDEPWGQRPLDDGDLNLAQRFTWAELPAGIS